MNIETTDNKSDSKPRTPLYKSRSWTAYGIACLVYLIAGWRGMEDAGVLAYGIAAGLSVLVGGEKATDWISQRAKGTKP